MSRRYLVLARNDWNLTNQNLHGSSYLGPCVYRVRTLCPFHRSTLAQPCFIEHYFTESFLGSVLDALSLCVNLDFLLSRSSWDSHQLGICSDVRFQWLYGDVSSSFHCRFQMAYPTILRAFSCLTIKN